MNGGITHDAANVFDASRIYATSGILSTGCFKMGYIVQILCRSCLENIHMTITWTRKGTNQESEPNQEVGCGANDKPLKRSSAHALWRQRRRSRKASSVERRSSSLRKSLGGYCGCTGSLSFYTQVQVHQKVAITWSVLKSGLRNLCMTCRITHW